MFVDANVTVLFELNGPLQYFHQYGFSEVYSLLNCDNLVLIDYIQ